MNILLRSLNLLEINFTARKSESKQNLPVQKNVAEAPSTSEDGDAGTETSRFASETVESERDSLQAYKQATANAKTAPQIVIEPPGIQGHGDADNSRAEDDQSACTFMTESLSFYFHGRFFQ